MSYLAALLIVFACAAGAAMAGLLVNRFVSLDLRGRYADEGARIFAQLGTMFALLLAFAFNQVWAEHSAAAQAIDGECGALHGAADLAEALPNHAGRSVNLAIIAYARTVVREEWPTMATRRSGSEAAYEDFRLIIQQTVVLNPTGGSDAALQGQMLSLFAQAKGYRETRLFQADQGLPFVLWFVLDVLAISLIALVAVGTTKGSGHVLLASAFTATIVMVLMLVALLDFPFEGSVSLPPADFVKLITDVSRVMAAR
jgi:hypothetical protein